MDDRQVERGKHVPAVDRLLGALERELDRFREACLAKLHANYAQVSLHKEPQDQRAIEERHALLREFVTHACNNMKQEIAESCRPTLEIAARATVTWSRHGPEAQQEMPHVSPLAPQQPASWREAWKQRHEIVTSYDVQRRQGRQLQPTQQRERKHAQGYGR